MSPELKTNLEVQLKGAMTSGDSKRIDEALCNSMNALIDCQMKTAMRVKEERSDMYELQRKMSDQFDNLKSDIRSMRDKGTGAWAVIQTLLKIAALGGGSVGVAGAAKLLGLV